jgi:hypothetical protein
MFCYYIISLRRIFIFYTHNNSQIILHHSVYEISHIQKIKMKKITARSDKAYYCLLACIY